jgi:hypothetical protein
LPDDSIQTHVDKWLDGKLGEDLRKPYPERNVLVQNLRDEMHAEFAEQLGDDHATLKDNYDEAFQMALHKDVRKGIVEANAP